MDFLKLLNGKRFLVGSESGKSMSIMGSSAWTFVLFS